MSWQYMGDACEVCPTNKQQTVLDALIDASALLTPKSLSPKAIAETTGLDVKYIKGALKKFIDTGKVEKTDYGLYVYAGDSYYSDDSTDFTDLSDSDDSSDHDDTEDCADLKDTDDSTDCSDADNIINFKSASDTDDCDDPSGVTEVTAVIKRSKRKRT